MLFKNPVFIFLVILSSPNVIGMDFVEIQRNHAAAERGKFTFSNPGDVQKYVDIFDSINHISFCASNSGDAEDGNCTLRELLATPTKIFFTRGVPYDFDRITEIDIDLMAFRSPSLSSVFTFMENCRNLNAITLFRSGENVKSNLADLGPLLSQTNVTTVCVKLSSLEFDPTELVKGLNVTIVQIIFEGNYYDTLRGKFKHLQELLFAKGYLLAGNDWNLENTFYKVHNGKVVVAYNCRGENDIKKINNEEVNIIAFPRKNSVSEIESLTKAFDEECRNKNFYSVVKLSFNLKNYTPKLFEEFVIPLVKKCVNLKHLTFQGGAKSLKDAQNKLAAHLRTVSNIDTIRIELVGEDSLESIRPFIVYGLYKIEVAVSQASLNRTYPYVDEKLQKKCQEITDFLGSFVYFFYRGQGFQASPGCLVDYSGEHYSASFYAY